MFYVLVVNGMHFHVVLVLQVQYMTDRFLQEWRKADGVLFKRMWIDGVYQYMIKRLGLTGNGRLYGWCYNKGASWEKKVRVQIL